MCLCGCVLLVEIVTLPEINLAPENGFFVVAFGIRQHFLLPSLASPTAPAQVVRAVNGIRANVFFGLRNDGGRIENIHFPGNGTFVFHGFLFGFAPANSIIFSYPSSGLIKAQGSGWHNHHVPT